MQRGLLKLDGAMQKEDQKALLAIFKCTPKHLGEPPSQQPHQGFGVKQNATMNLDLWDLFRPEGSGANKPADSDVERVSHSLLTPLCGAMALVLI